MSGFLAASRPSSEDELAFKTRLDAIMNDSPSDSNPIPWTGFAGSETSESPEDFLHDLSFTDTMDTWSSDSEHSVDDTMHGVAEDQPETEGTLVAPSSWGLQWLFILIQTLLRIPTAFMLASGTKED